MARATSNMAATSAAIHRLADAFDLSSDGLGEDLLDVMAVGIIERSLGRQEAPSGRPWAPNAPRYAAGPRKRGKPIGVLDGQMLSLPEVRGERVIEANRAAMSYGISEDARRKLGWFTKGKPARYSRDVKGRFLKGSRVEGTQPPRPLYGLDEQIRAAVDAAAAEYLETVVGRL